MSNFSSTLKRLESENNLRKLRTLRISGNNVEFEGKQYYNLSSNDYLGIAANIDFQKEFIQQLQLKKNKDFIFGSSSSRLLTGNHPAYSILERQLTELYQNESCLIFNSGYHANIGILPAITGKQDLILADKNVHASLIDGLRLSKARLERFRHNDLNHLVRLLKKHRNDYQNIVIVTESIFSMDGDYADLVSLCKIKKEWNTLLYVDEAHAFGIAGDQGLGLCEATNTIREIDFIVGTFGKAIASQGAYLVCKKEVSNFLVNTMRSLIFTTALPPINLIWTSFIISKLNKLKDKRESLHRQADTLRKNLIKMGFITRGESHIVPIIVDKNETAISLSNHLISEGYWTLPIRYPTVPKGEARIRVSLNPEFNDRNIQLFINSISKWKQNG